VNKEDIREPLRLLRTPVPKPDESLMGYILRLTEENGYDTPNWIFNLARLNIKVFDGGWSALIDNDFVSTSLEQLLGLEHSEFNEIKSRFSELNYQVLTTIRSASVSLIKFHAPKVCPACLEQASYYRGVWDLFPFTACPTHSAVLIDRCPRCGKRISWVRQKVSVCRCGFDWRGSKPIKVTPLALEVPRQLLKFCGLSSGGSHPTENRNNPLYELNLKELCEVLTLIASYYGFIKEGRHITTRTENLICNNYYSYVSHTFEDWPENFYKFLDGARWKKGTKLHEQLHRQMCRQFERGPLDFIIVAIENYIRSHGNHPGLSWSLLSGRRFVNTEEACYLLGLEPKWLDALITRGKLEIFRRRGRDAEVLIDTQSITDLKIELGYLINISQAARVLDIKTKDVEELVDRGYLKPASGPSVDGFREWKFNVNGINALLEMIRERVTNLTLTPLDTLISTIAVIQEMERRGLSVSHFVQTILEGKVIPLRFLIHHGLSGFAFSREQVMRYLHAPT
jgi:hypothetical protein